MNVGLVGLGYMGEPMGHRLLEQGHHLSVFDIDSSRAEQLSKTGAVSLESAAAVGAASDVVCTSLSNLKAIRDVILNEENGLLSTMAPGSTIIELSTSSWNLTRELAARAKERGVGYIDCPVSGAGGKPDSGKLTLMVGGEPEVVDRCRPVLGDLGTIHYVGPTGSGTAAKLITQYIGYTSMLAGIEAIVWAEKADVDLKSLFEIIPVSAARGRISPNVLEELAQRDFGDPVSRRPSMPTYIIEKDLELALEFANELGVSADTGAAGHALLVEGLRRGWSDYSFFRAIEILEERAGLRPKD